MEFITDRTYADAQKVIEYEKRGAGDSKGNGTTTGTEVLVYNSSSKSNSIAKNICAEIAKLGFKNRGVKYRTDLYVLNHTSIVKSNALLIECCFLDDKDDVNLYNAKKMAQAIVLGILNSYGVQKYKAKKNINSFTSTLKKNGKIKKNKICQIDKFIFTNGYLLGHRKKADTWAKIKYLGLQ